jgi:hypothetical protein
MTEKKTKTYTESEVKKLLDKQIEACADQINDDNLSMRNAQKKIKETKRVK